MSVHLIQTLREDELQTLIFGGGKGVLGETGGNGRNSTLSFFPPSPEPDASIKIVPMGGQCDLRATGGREKFFECGMLTILSSPRCHRRSASVKS